MECASGKEIKQNFSGKSGKERHENGRCQSAHKAFHLKADALLRFFAQFNFSVLLLVLPQGRSENFRQTFGMHGGKNDSIVHPDGWLRRHEATKIKNKLRRVEDDVSPVGVFAVGDFFVELNLQLLGRR